MDAQPPCVAIPEQLANPVSNLVGCLVEHEGVVGVLNFQIPVLLQHPGREVFEIVQFHGAAEDRKIRHGEASANWVSKRIPAR